MEELIAYIRANMTDAELWGQLAEELTEMAQAALKMQRFGMPLNAPRKSYDRVLDSFIEEHADVVLCLKVLRWNDRDRRAMVELEKASRWVEIIRARKDEREKANRWAETVREEACRNAEG